MAHNTVRRQYDRWAAVYDRIWARYTRRTLSVLEDAARAAPSEHTLDVGCGTGAFAARLLARNPAQPITGVDLSEKMLARARRKLRAHPHAAFEQARAEALPFAEDRFDLVVSASALHYFEDPEAALAEMRRVCRPGGRVLVLDWCRDFLACRLFDAVLRRLDPAHRRCYTLGALCRLFEGAGLAVRSARRFRAGLVWGLMLVEATREPEETPLPGDARLRRPQDTSRVSED